MVLQPEGVRRYQRPRRAGRCPAGQPTRAAPRSAGTAQPCQAVRPVRDHRTSHNGQSHKRRRTQPDRRSVPAWMRPRTRGNGADHAATPPERRIDAAPCRGDQ